MAYVRKWLVGGYITSLDELMVELDRPRDEMRWVFQWVRPLHPAVIANWQFGHLAQMVKRRQLRWGILNPAYKPPAVPRRWGGKRLRPSKGAFGHGLKPVLQLQAPQS